MYSCYYQARATATAEFFFGLRTGPCHFDKISSFIANVLKNVFHIDVVHYLDDFLCKGACYEECEFAQNCVISVLRYLGFYVSWKKVVSPSKITKYLGIIVE